MNSLGILIDRINWLMPGNLRNEAFEFVFLNETVKTNRHVVLNDLASRILDAVGRDDGDNLTNHMDGSETVNFYNNVWRPMWVAATNPEAEAAGNWAKNIKRMPRKPEEPNPLPLDAIRVTRRVEPGSDGRISLYTLEITNIKTESGKRVLMEVLPRVLELFLVKNQDYGDDMGAMRLGPKGQFVDIWRKVGKLKRALWDGEKMAGEQADEMFMDLIGHILLSLNEMWDGLGRDG